MLTRLANCAEIPPGQGKAFRVAERHIAVFNVDGNFHAIDNRCPHRGGPLAEGPLDGRIVICPWHGWEFDVTNGQLRHDAKVRVICYELRVENGGILLALPG